MRSAARPATRRTAPPMAGCPRGERVKAEPRRSLIAAPAAVCPPRIEDQRQRDVPQVLRGSGPLPGLTAPPARSVGYGTTAGPRPLLAIAQSPPFGTLLRSGIRESNPSLELGKLTFYQ